MITNLKLHLVSDTLLPAPPIPVPPSGPLKYLYATPDLIGRSMPATRKVRNDKSFRVSPALEAYIWGMDKLLNPNMPDALFLRYWKSLYNGGRAFDNGNAWGSLAWKLENLFCAGATLLPFEPHEIDGGWIKVHAIDPNNPPEVPTDLSLISMCLNFFPTTSATMSNGAFPQFEGRCLEPFLGEDGFNWVELDPHDEVRGPLVWTDTIQHPFIPARPQITAGLMLAQV